MYTDDIYIENNYNNKDFELKELNNDDDDDDNSENEEMKSIIYKTINHFNLDELNDNNNNNNNNNNIKKKNKKNNNCLTLNEFNNKTNEPVKFISKRAEERKKNAEVYKRKFNPRLPPYITIKNKKLENIKKIDINNIEIFPKLT